MRPELLVCYENVGEAGDFLAKAAVEVIRNPKSKPIQKLEMPRS